MRIIITENQLKKLIIKESNDVNSEDQLIKAKNLVKKLQNKGFSYTGAVGLVGNIAHETGGTFDPAINQTGGPAKGLMQWENPRFTALEKFAKYKGKNWANLNTQVDFMKFELLDKYLYGGELLPDFKKSPLNAIALYKQKDGTYKGVMGYETKQYKKSIVDGDIEQTTKNLMDNVFRPAEGNSEMRIENSKKIDEFIKNGGNTNKSDESDEEIITGKPTVSPNPAIGVDKITINYKSNAPITKIKVILLDALANWIAEDEMEDDRYPNLKNSGDHKFIFNLPSNIKAGVYYIAFEVNGKRDVLHNSKFIYKP